jgi:hypothetical protein
MISGCTKLDAEDAGLVIKRCDASHYGATTGCVGRLEKAYHFEHEKEAEADTFGRNPERRFPEAAQAGHE